jgi:hypothetical protein
MWYLTFSGLVSASTVIVLYEFLRVRPLRRRIEKIDEDAHALKRAVSGQAGLHNRLTQVEHQFRGQAKHLASRLGQLELRSESRPYERAIDQAARGDDAERLVAHFGLSEGEASLVRLLHGKSSPSKHPREAR